LNLSAESLQILFQDSNLIAVHKPAGLLVHKSPIDKRETRYAMRILRDQIGAWVYPVHRLDKPTSGVLLFALSTEIAALVARQFEQREVRKRYRAIVRGFAPEAGHVDHPLREIAAFKSDQAQADLKEAQDAQTDFERLARYELPYSDGQFPSSRYSLIQLAPHTGRKHQLRRHLKHISHPIIGDVKYGKGPHNRLFRTLFSCDRLLLAATSLSLHHPITNAPLHMTCDVEENFSDCLHQLESFQL